MPSYATLRAAQLHDPEPRRGGAADLFRCDLVRTSFIPPGDIRECRVIFRWRFKLVDMCSSGRNRNQTCMTVSIADPGNVLSDCMG